MKLSELNKYSFIIIPALAIIAYANSLDIPWYYDDYEAILENPSIRSINTALSEIYRPRGFANFSFALNYAFSQSNPTSYHLFNIFLHIASALMIYVLILKLCKENPAIPLVCAAIFAVHPANTQAVNYIVQRSTLLAALFSLLAIYFYIISRKIHTNDKQVGRAPVPYFMAIIFGFLAVHTKQNAATLPGLLFIFEYLLAKNTGFNWRKTAGTIAPFCIAPIIITVATFVMPLATGEASISTIAGTRELSNLSNASPLNYFLTELHVFFIYLRLIILPTNLALDYSIPITENILSAKVIFPAILIALILAFSFKIRHKYPELAFGVFWFFTALIVESTFIPLDTIFEHRLYLPMIGPLFALVYYSFKFKNQKITIALFFVAIIVFTFMSLQRNQLWKDPIAFMEDNVQKAPHSEGVLVALSGRYLQTQRYDDAINTLKQAQKINPDFPDIYLNLSSVLIEKDDFREALKVTLQGLQKKPNDLKLLNNLGLIYTYTGNSILALEILQPLAAQSPQNYKIKLLIGKNLLDIQRPEEAKNQLEQAIRLSGNDYRPHYFLGVACYQLGKPLIALREFEAALKLSPTDPQTLFSLGVVSIEMGDTVRMARALDGLKKNAPNKALELKALMRQSDQIQ